MDSITQIVLGSAAGEAVLGRKAGNKAILWGAIAGTIPDLDVVVRLFTDDLTANEMHRGFSHSIVFSILFAPVLGWLANFIHKNPEIDWKDWTKLMFWSLVTHPLLDAHTAWGTQLFWPLDYKITYNNIFIVDPLYTLPFMLFLILAMFQKKENPRRRFFNTTGIIISCSYMVLTLCFKGFAHYHFTKELESQKIQYTAIEAKPTPFNSILWCAFVETENSFLLGYYSLLDKPGPVTFTVFPKKQNDLGKMKDEDIVKRLIKLSRGWYNIEASGETVQYYDLRFGQAGITNDPKSFVNSYDLYYENGILKAKQNRKGLKNVGPAIKQLLKRIYTN